MHTLYCCDQQHNSIHKYNLLFNGTVPITRFMERWDVSIRTWKTRRYRIYFSSLSWHMSERTEESTSSNCNTREWGSSENESCEVRNLTFPSPYEMCTSLRKNKMQVYVTAWFTSLTGSLHYHFLCSNTRAQNKLCDIPQKLFYVQNIKHTSKYRSHYIWNYHFPKERTKLCQNSAFF